MDVACVTATLEEEKADTVRRNPCTQAGEIPPKKRLLLKRIKGFISHGFKKSVRKDKNNCESADELGTSSGVKPQPGCSDMDVTMKEPREQNLLPKNSNSLQENDRSSKIREREKEMCSGQILRKKCSVLKRIKGFFTLTSKRTSESTQSIKEGKTSHSKVIKQGRSYENSLTTSEDEPVTACSHWDLDGLAAHKTYTTSDSEKESSTSSTNEPQSDSSDMKEDSNSLVVSKGSEPDSENNGDSDRDVVDDKQGESDDESSTSFWKGFNNNVLHKRYENAVLKVENAVLKKEIEDLKDIFENIREVNSVLQAEYKDLKEQRRFKNLDTNEPRKKRKRKSHSEVIQQGKSDGNSSTSSDNEPQPGCTRMNRDEWVARRNKKRKPQSKVIKATTGNNISDKDHIPGFTTHRLFGMVFYLPEGFISFFQSQEAWAQEYHWCE